MSIESYEQFLDLGRAFGVEIHRPGRSQLHFLVESAPKLMQFCSRLREESCWLIMLVTNDERELEDNCFKQYYFFTHSELNVFIVIELALSPGLETYPSILPIFPSVAPFEREIADLFGLRPDKSEDQLVYQTYLHSCYPQRLFPLRRDWDRGELQRLSSNFEQESNPFFPSLAKQKGEGELDLPVGPIHAGVIEPGKFTFRTSGEIIERLEYQLGYTHKGIEHLFQREYDLENGWRLAEKVVGDSSFSHSLAYCKAVEVLSSVVVPPQALLLRAIFLEMERITNHLADCAGLVHDIAFEIISSELSVLREEMMQLNGRLTGSRFLRGVNRPGGVVLGHSFDGKIIRPIIRRITERFLSIAQTLVEHSGFRDRTSGVGVLSRETALHFGVTGLAARASGVRRDFRIQHPFGPYSDSDVQDLLQGQAEGGLPISISVEMNGDVFSRFIQRVIEVWTSYCLIEYFLDKWENCPPEELLSPLRFSEQGNFEWGLGYVEGWRGDVVYWVMKDKFNRIYRCKVRDPSTLNWPGLAAAVMPKSFKRETALADFPIINKSFSLSYSGNDL